ncbi:MAG: 2,3-bisphosphoglycerate-independent phosphoglycerate mutase, partial [Candidatus Eisenbacteria bacterium]|nr:2,3-bisphosphoglycerate-independent phosphoglycerate mutase [Candidatus Eisenbacteria bacterium]
MSTVRLPDDVVVPGQSKIVLLVLDGLGGIQDPRHGKTELQAARTPNLDRLAAEGTCGVLDPIAPGITPGSGPSHMALFGYDPLACNIGRGVLSALGVGFDLTSRDLAARANFATVDAAGNVTDRRAGRISSEENARLCEKVARSVKLPAGMELFIQTEREHRAVVVFRGDGLHEAVSDTDPQRVGVRPPDPAPLEPGAETAAAVVRSFLEQAHRALADERPANAILLRGFAIRKPYPSFAERFKLRAAAVARYPMYRGLARLIGMQVLPPRENLDAEMELLRAEFQKHDFFYFHVKKTDSAGEDGDFASKVEAIELVDSKIPSLMALSPDVVVVTADHSTPSLLKAHSWHPVPMLLRAESCRVDEVRVFDETSCARGGFGRMPMVALMSL